MKAPKLKLGPPGEDFEEVEIDGGTLRLGLGWKRGEHYRVSPVRSTMLLSTAVERQILQGWLPEQPIIDASTPVLALGSCFAQTFADHLHRRRYRSLTRPGGSDAAGNTHVVRIHAGMATSFNLRLHLEWALEGKSLDLPLWRGFDAEALGFDEGARREARARYLRAEVFLVTLGLSEVWEDRRTGEAFWQAVPRDRFDPERHRFRVSSVAENVENLRAIYRILRKHRPAAKIILTLSPVSLYATFRPQSCISANAASKAILRASIDEFWREVEGEGHLDYWPSYEIATEAFETRFREDRRQIKGRIVTYIMLLFEKFYCRGHTPEAEAALLQAFIEARAVGGTYPFDVVEALEKKDLRWLRGRVRAACRNGHFESIEPLVRRCCQLFPDEEEFPRFLTLVERTLGLSPGPPAPSRSRR